MSMLELRHYAIRFQESHRLRYRLPRLVWRFVTRALVRHGASDRPQV